MNVIRGSGRSAARGFTLVELMVGLVILAVVVLAVATLVLNAQRSKAMTANNLESTEAARIASDMIARDLRAAGYGADQGSSPKQLPIAYVDSLELIVNENLNPFPDSSAVKGYPLAYNPNTNPRPFELNGTPWQPPMRYLTGAESVRWTLDANNDGVVNAADMTSPNGLDAQRTRNPNDYVIIRQVYGDSTGGTTGNNGGTVERIGLVSRPGNGVAPLYTVYLNGSADPWDWSNGPVPAGQLKDITRVTVTVTSESPRPDYKGRYARSVFKTDVSSLRNVPNFGTAGFDLDGWVYNDKNSNGVRNPGDLGLAGVTLRLGAYSAVTDASGYFYFNVPSGTYTLRQVPPAGYSVYTSPDSFVVTLGPDQQRSFADVALPGGTVNCSAFQDLNANLVRDPGEPGVQGCKFQLAPTNQVAYADTGGKAQLFAPVGGYSVACTSPDSFIVLSPNPVSGTMTNGGSTNADFALSSTGFGYIRGMVFNDYNRNGVLDGGEQGIANVWVGVTSDGGITISGYAYTNASGAYQVKCPANDPPHTNPVSVMCIPPAGFYPTSTTSITPVWVQNGQTITNQNFGMSSYQVITLNASRVLSLASADLIEKDWPGTSTNLAHADADIVLGADAAGTDQISTWFNQWNATPLFSVSPTYTRSAPQAVMAMALDTLDGNAPKNRPDLVTGTKATASGNFFVWFNQNSSGNEGYFPTTYSAAQNYKTNDNGDVQAVLTYDCAGGASADYPDIIVGTKSPTAGQGTVEIWKSNNATTPAFTREEIYPTAGSTPSGMGEVTCMVLADFDNDGKKDLAIGTTTGAYSGQVILLKFTSKNSTPHFTYMGTISLPLDAVTALTAVDVNGDGTKDLVVGTQRTTSSGKLIYLRNTVPATFTFSAIQALDAPGIVTSLLSADFGGLSKSDLAMGFRQTSTSYVGGVRVYYLDGPVIPPNGTDPSGGAVTNWVPAVTSNDFNFGANPTPSAPYLPDLAAGVKYTATTGALVVFVR